MKRIFLVPVIACFFSQTHCQSINLRDDLTTSINTYYTEVLKDADRQYYQPIINNLEFTINEIFNELANDCLNLDNYNIYLLIGTNYLGNIIWCELWLDNQTQYYCRVRLKNKETLVSRDFPMPLSEYKNDVMIWDEIFKNRSTIFTDVADGSYFIALTGKVDKKLVSNIKVKAFVEY